MHVNPDALPGRGLQGEFPAGAGHAFGWDNAAVPPRAVMPVFGGYADAPWDASLEKLPSSEVYTFRFGSRVSGNMGTMGGAAGEPESASHNGVPFLTAEIGSPLRNDSRNATLPGIRSSLLLQYHDPVLKDGHLSNFPGAARVG